MIDITSPDLYEPFWNDDPWDGTKYVLENWPPNTEWQMKEQLALGTYIIGIEFKVTASEPWEQYTWETQGNVIVGPVLGQSVLGVDQQILFEYTSSVGLATKFSLYRYYPTIEVTKIFIMEDDPRFWRNFKGQTERT